MAFNILIVDDESDIRNLVAGILEDNGYETETAGCYVDAIESIQKRRPNLVILDVWLGEGDKDGLRLLELIKKEYEYVPVIMMSGHGTIETAVSAIKRGAHDFIEKPFDSRRLVMSVEKAIETSKLQMENADLRIKAKVSDNILGKSQNVINIKQQVEKIALLGGRCVIIGPIGSTKEVVAKEIHRLSNRSKSPFGFFNCRSYGSKQLETELLGTEIKDGSDVTKIKQGIFEKINGGTLFIDEMSFIPYDLQMKILKILKEDSFSRIGSHERIHLNLRVIAGFQSNIEDLIKSREFSDELFCRLNANMIKIQPLKSRREDIAYLLDYYMEQSAKAHNITPMKFSNEALGILNSYSWPGDVMQMKNMIDWILTVSIAESENNGIISIEDLPKEIVEGKPSTPSSNNVQFISTVSELSIRDAREAFEREYFIEQLRRFSGNISQTAKFVGMERSALHRKLKSLNIVDSKLFKDDEE